jgi:hypothetical protein
VLSVELAGGPQHGQERQAPETEKQETAKHDCPPLVANSDGRPLWTCAIGTGFDQFDLV